MRIFFFTTVFSPSIGGIETLAELLCRQFVKMGHEVRLATCTPGATCTPDEEKFPFNVTRRPSLRQYWQILRWCDVHVQANISLRYAWPRFIMPDKLIYQHNSIIQCVTGKLRLVDRLKITLAHHTAGIANSHYTAKKTGASHVVLNAYDDSVFKNKKSWTQRDHDVAFLGRLVSQKGCDMLLRALKRLSERGHSTQLTIIGSGPDRPLLEALAKNEGIASRVNFVGAIQGKALAELLNRHRILAVPSQYEEPFGIVALEGLACGCIPVVSERGGLIDAIGKHGFTFPNGDESALADTLEQLLRNPQSAYKRLCGVGTHLAQFHTLAVAENYINIFQQHIGMSRS
jgi:glycogen synthase